MNEKTTRESEHRKTPNRLGVLENGDIGDQCERSLDELRKSVEKIVQSLDKNADLARDNGQNILSQDNSKSYNFETNHNSTPDSTPNHLDGVKVETDQEQGVLVKKLNIFEKLGQCMEKENMTDEELKADVKAEVKEELKNEILNELKLDIKNEMKSDFKSEIEEEKTDPENKWFSILSKEGNTCEGKFIFV